MNIDTIIVFDDIRKLSDPNEYSPVSVIHCETEPQFIAALQECMGQTIQVILDHDLGLMGIGSDITARNGISTMIDMHSSGELTVFDAFVVTMNPDGRKWICNELDKVSIPYHIDMGGTLLQMVCPNDWKP